MSHKVDQSANSILIIAGDTVAQPADSFNEDTCSSEGIQAVDRATGLPVWGLRCAVRQGPNQLSRKIKMIAAEQPVGFNKGGLLAAQGLDFNLYENALFVIFSPLDIRALVIKA